MGWIAVGILIHVADEHVQAGDSCASQGPASAQLATGSGKTCRRPLRQPPLSHESSW